MSSIWFSFKVINIITYGRINVLSGNIAIRRERSKLSWFVIYIDNKPNVGEIFISFGKSVFKLSKGWDRYSRRAIRML